MTLFRFCILFAGPVLLVSAFYWLTFADSQQGFSLRADVNAPLTVEPSPADQRLVRQCEEAGEVLRQRLAPTCQVLVRSPYVLAGDLPLAQLEAHYHETILPTQYALRTSYFDRMPDQPILVVLCATDESYRDFATRLDGRERAAYYGYYQRDHHRLVINASTGNGTLSHELTHALSQFDFPQMPEWFDEGLASLHEECEFDSGETHLTALPNWRLHYLLQGLQRGQLDSIESMLARDGVRPGLETIDYAQARYFCYYLQTKGLLRPFYRKYREGYEHDPRGVRTLYELLRQDSLAAIDRDFRRWVQQLGEQNSRHSSVPGPAVGQDSSSLSTRIPTGAQGATEPD